MLLIVKVQFLGYSAPESRSHMYNKKIFKFSKFCFKFNEFLIDTIREKVRQELKSENQKHKTESDLRLFTLVKIQGMLIMSFIYQFLSNSDWLSLMKLKYT